MFALFIGCESPMEPASDQNDPGTSNVLGKKAKSTPGNTGDNTSDGCDSDGIVTLWAGKTINVGTVTVTYDVGNIYVTYTTTGSWKIYETHLDLSTSAYTERGAPGHYDYQQSHNGVTSYTYTVPNQWASATSVYFLAHAVVGKGGSSTETAYGGTVVKPKKGSWYGTFCYVINAGPPAPTYQISGFTFVDANQNGVKDAGEISLPNVAVSLSGGATTTSDANGAYTFSGVVAGSYTVTAGTVSGYAQTSPASVPVVITTSNGTANFAYSRTYTISGTVYDDQLFNGTRDSFEPPLVGYTVKLGLSVSSPALFTVQTDAQGNFSFSGLLPGTYFVVAPTTSVYTASYNNSAVVTITNADVSLSFGLTQEVTPLKSINPGQLKARQ